MQRLIGHQDALSAIRRSLASGTFAHAHLVTGPRGAGRRTLALHVAAALNCAAAPGARPCGQCRACRLTMRGVHPDVRVVRRSPDRKVIMLKPPQGSSPPRDYADNVEFIQSDAQMRPLDGRRKVYVILNAEDLSPEAANRLLKTLEEPTQFVTFLLTAGDRGAVLPTILSRCQEIRLQPVPRDVIAAALVAEGLSDPATALRLAALAEGRPGWALSAARDSTLLEQYHADTSQLRQLLAGSRLERLAQARTLTDRWQAGSDSAADARRDSVRTALRTWLGWWRDVLLLQAGIAGRVPFLEPADAAAVRTAAEHLRVGDVRTAQHLVDRSLADLDANVNARATFDLLALRLPRLPEASASH